MSVGNVQLRNKKHVCVALHQIIGNPEMRFATLKNKLEDISNFRSSKQSIESNIEDLENQGITVHAIKLKTKCQNIVRNTS